MTTKIITGHYPGGYTLNAAFSRLSIASSATVGGAGVAITTQGTVLNSGYVSATNPFAIGITLENGGAVVNEADGSISGQYGVRSGSEFGTLGTVTNYGFIAGSRTGVDLASAGGTLRNVGVVAGGNYGVLISAGTVSNFGEIYSSNNRFYQVGALLLNTSSLTNGALNDTTALITGANGVESSGGAVSNYGTVLGVSAYTFGKGVSLTDEASLTNGAATDRTALISGDTGVVAYLSQSAIANFGTIQGSSAEMNPGVYFNVGGGSLVNGSGADKTALVQGYDAVKAYDGVVTVTNFGVIDGTGSYGVLLEAGGQVTNGSAADKSALIEGRTGVEMQGAAGTVKNFGSILANDGLGDYGVYLKAGGSLTNGSAKDSAALIQGYGGVELLGGAATNFGTIRGTGATYGYGAELGAGTRLTNGAAGDTTATVEGHQGVFVGGAASTLTNFGTIRSGSGSVAVEMYTTSDTLVVEAGSTFIGAVLGGGGTLDLASGTGTLTGLLAGGDVTVSGSMATTPFTDFGTVEVSAGATFTAHGPSTLAAGQAVIAAGSLTIAGGLTSAGFVDATGAGNLTILGGLNNTGMLQVDKGVLTAKGAVTGSGQAKINGGTLDFASSFTQNVVFGKSGMLELAQSQGYAGTITGFSKTGATSLDLADISFVSPTEATFSGTKSSGVLTVSDGTHTAHVTLIGNYTGSTFIASSDGHEGVTVIDPTAPQAAIVAPSITGGGAHRFIAAVAGFGAGDGAASFTAQSLAGRIDAHALAVPSERREPLP